MGDAAEMLTGGTVSKVLQVVFPSFEPCGAASWLVFPLVVGAQVAGALVVGLARRAGVGGEGSPSSPRIAAIAVLERLLPLGILDEMAEDREGLQREIEQSLLIARSRR